MPTCSYPIQQAFTLQDNMRNLKTTKINVLPFDNLQGMNLLLTSHGRRRLCLQGHQQCYQVCCSKIRKKIIRNVLPISPFHPFEISIQEPKFHKSELKFPESSVNSSNLGGIGKIPIPDYLATLLARFAPFTPRQNAMVAK